MDIDYHALSTRQVNACLLLLIVAVVSREFAIDPLSVDIIAIAGSFRMPYGSLSPWAKVSSSLVAIGACPDTARSEGQEKGG